MLEMRRKRCLILLLLWLVLPYPLFAENSDAPALKEKPQQKTAGETINRATDDDVARLQEIVVTTSRLHNPVTPVTTRYATQYNVVTEEQIKEQSSPDFLSALRNVPGVMFQSKNLMGGQSSHSMYIRGRGASHPGSDFAILYDDVPRFGALFGQVMGDGIALSTIGSIEIFKSPQPSEFGSGYASVNVKPRYMDKAGSEVIVDAGGGSFHTFGQSLAAGMKKGPYDVYAVQSWGSTAGHRDHSRAQQHSYYLNAGYDLARSWNVRFLANYVDSQTVAPMPETMPASHNRVNWPMAERFDTRTFLTTLSLNNRYDKASGYIKAYLNDTDFDLLQELNKGVRYGEESGGLWSRQKIVLYGVRAKERFFFRPGGEVVVGADLDFSELKNRQWTYTGLAVPGINGGRAERAWNFPVTVLFSPFAAVSHFFGSSDGLHAIASTGYRYLRHNEFKSASSYQAGLVTGYAHTDININYARGVNYPLPVVLMNMVRTDVPLANAVAYWQNIKPEVVDHYEASLSHTWPQKGAVNLTYFQDKGKDRFQAYMFGPVPVSFNDAIGRYKIRGVEVSGTFMPLKDMELFAGATWLRARTTGSDGIEQDHMPYTPGFQAQAGFSWLFLERIKFRLDAQYLQEVYAATSTRSGNFNFAMLTDDNRLKDFVLVNGRLGYTFNCKKLSLQGSEIYVAVNNIFNRHYEYDKGYSMPGVTVFAGLTLKFKHGDAPSESL